MKFKNKFKTLLPVTILLLLVFNLPVRTFAWGKTGHTIVIHIAMKLLTPQAKNQVNRIMSLHSETLEGIAVWADGIRGSRSNPGPRVETPRWHFVDIPLNEQYDAQRDCVESPNGSCAISAIVAFQDVLSGLKKGYYNDAFNRYEALKFIAHFVGDVHQPLHCVDDNDAGGNLKPVNWFGNDSLNLHHVWDDDILEKNMGQRNADAYADFLYLSLTQAEKNLANPQTSQQPTVVGRDEIETWAKEAHSIARHAYSDIGQKTNNHYHLGQPYYAAHKNEVTAQLKFAAIHLARILNENLR